MSVAVGDKLLAFLAHRCERPGGRESVNASTMNPGFFTPNDVVRNARLQDIINDRVLGVPPDLRNLRFALVDLTGDKLNKPEFAGHRDLEQGGVASMAKLACMYAAYQLQFDLQHFLTIGPPPEEKRFFSGMREFWRMSQIPMPGRKATNIFPAKPRIDLVESIVGSRVRVDGRFIPVPRPYSSPDLEEMFTIDGAQVKFKGSDKTLVDAATPPRFGTLSQEARDYHDKHPDGNLTAARKLSFADRLFLMIDDSDNPCSHTCIENVSFLYIISSIWQADIYRPERGGGLWEGNNQDPNPRDRFAWQKPPVPQGNPKADFVSGTPASIAALYTLMARDRLVSKNASISMRHLTDRKRSSFNRSFFRDGLRNGGIFPERLHAKIGIADDKRGPRDDSALIEREVDPTPRAPVKVRTRIRYVAVACDDVPGPKGLHDLIVRLDTCIRENNGLMTKQEA